MSEIVGKAEKQAWGKLEFLRSPADTISQAESQEAWTSTEPYLARTAYAGCFVVVYPSLPPRPALHNLGNAR